jgi:hypothetical protein
MHEGIVSKRPDLGFDRRKDPRGAIAAASTFAMLCSSRASSVAASHPIPTICATFSHARWAAKRAMNSRCRSAACITRPRIAQATNEAAGIDPIKIARRLWKQTRVKEERLPADEIMQTPQSGLALNSQPIGSTGRDIG